MGKASEVRAIKIDPNKKKETKCQKILLRRQKNLKNSPALLASGGENRRRIPSRSWRVYGAGIQPGARGGRLTRMRWQIKSCRLYLGTSN